MRIRLAQMHECTTLHRTASDGASIKIPRTLGPAPMNAFSGLRSLATQLGEAIRAPPFAANAVMHEEESIGVVAALYCREARIVRGPNRPAANQAERSRSRIRTRPAHARQRTVLSSHAQLRPHCGVQRQDRARVRPHQQTPAARCRPGSLARTRRPPPDSSPCSSLPSCSSGGAPARPLFKCNETSQCSLALHSASTSAAPSLSSRAADNQAD